MPGIKLLVKNKLIRIFLGLFFAVCSLSVLFFLVNLIPTKLVVYPGSNSETIFLKLGEAQSFESIFKAEANLLNRVDVLFKNPNLESRDELDMLLLDNNGRVVVSQKFSGFNLGDTTQARMDFSPIPDSKDKVYKVLVIPTKIIDGKLSIGTKDREVEFIQYYRFGTSIKNAWERSLLTIVQIVKYQPVVLILPIFFTVMCLW